MSLHGRDVLSTINSTYQEAAERAEKSRSHLSDLQSEHSSASRDLRNAYDAIVSARHDDPLVDRSALESVDRWLVQSANKRKDDYEKIVDRLSGAGASAAESDERHEAASERNRRAIDAWKRARASMRDVLGQQEAFATHLDRQSSAVRRSQAVDEHLDEITKATREFEKACMADPVFVYCHERNVGTEKAQGWWLVRGLDRLVARSNNYYASRAHLLGAREDLDNWVRHQALMSQELSEANAVVEKAIDEALLSPEGRELSEELANAKATLAEVGKDRDQAHARVAMLENEKALYDQEQDPLFLEMEKKLLAAVERASDRDLERAASETRDSSDDRAAVRVAELRQKIPQLNAEITRANKSAEADKENADRLRKFISSFKSQGFDDRYSRFDYGFDATRIATQVMLGQMSVSSAIGKCDHAHRDVTPPPPPPPSYSPSPSWGGGSSGGFSSGGSIGGGGGFSTGGRF